jgi:hypothetical protein
MVAGWLRHYTTSQEVVGSRPDEKNGFINLTNPSGCTRPWDLNSLQQKRVPEAEKHVSGK